MCRMYEWSAQIRKELHTHLFPPIADKTRQGNKKYIPSSSCINKVYKGKIIVRPDGFTAPCRSIAKARNWNMFSNPGHLIKMKVDNNSFESFKVLHIYYFILSSQTLSETDSIDYYYHRFMEKTKTWKVYETYLKSYRKSLTEFR